MYYICSPFIQEYPMDTVGCLHCLAIENNAVMNMGIQMSVQVSAFSSLAVSQGRSAWGFLSRRIAQSLCLLF